MSVVLWCFLSAVAGATLAYVFQASRRRILEAALDSIRSNSAVAEARLVDLTARHEAQIEELQRSSATNLELSTSRERLDANLSQANAVAAQLREEIEALRPELESERKRAASLDTARQVATARVESLDQAATQMRQRLDRCDTDTAATREVLTYTKAQHAALERECEGLRSQLVSQREWILEQTVQFEQRVLAAAATLMEERGKAFTETNKTAVDAIVAPFKEQLNDFRQRVDHIYASDNKDRGELKQQIVQLTTLNQTVSVQADRLTNALTITSKATGDWGETILRKILEDSGLRQGREYRLQYAITGQEGERMQPDAILFLPENRQLVVDSKVSNKAWKDYCGESDDTLRHKRLLDHLGSLRSHIKGLAAKNYSCSPDLQTVDFVLMFVPVEAALLTALASDDALYTEAFRNKIILVTPSTLMAVVKLVEGIWTLQKRKESADEIAEAGRKLYEKLTSFASTFIEVGDAVQKAQGAYEKARGQLSTGHGNAIRLAYRMVELGVGPAPGKVMPVQLGNSNPDDDGNDGGTIIGDIAR